MRSVVSSSAHHEEDEGQDRHGDRDREGVGAQQPALGACRDPGGVERPVRDLVEPALDDRRLDLVAQPDGDRLRRAGEDRVVELVEPELVLERPSGRRRPGRARGRPRTPARRGTSRGRRASRRSRSSASPAPVVGWTSGSTTGSSHSSNGSQTPGICSRPANVEPTASTPTGTSIQREPSPWWACASSACGDLGRLPVEDEEVEPERVHPGQERAEEPADVEGPAERAALGERRGEDRVLRPEAGEDRDADERERADQERRVRVRQLRAQAAHLPDVLLAARGGG